MEKINGILVEKYGNSNLADFHLRYRAFKTRIDNFWIPLKESNRLQEVGEPGISILKNVAGILGIVEMCPRSPYELGVTKGAAFTWDELIPQIVAAIHAATSPAPTALEEIGEAALADEDLCRGLTE